MASAVEFRPTRPMVEPLALPTYAIIAFGCLTSAILVPLTGFTVAPDVWPIFMLPVFFAVSGMLARRVGHSLIGTVLEATALIYGQGLAFLLVMFPLTALSGPLADNSLAAADHALGFNWTGYAWAIAPIIDPLVIAYKSFAWQPVLIVLCLASNPVRLWRFVTAGAWAVVATTAIYPLVPALGSFRHYGLTGYPLHGDGPLVFGRVIELLKGGHRVISPDLFTGFVSFPSYHAAAAVIFIWAAWPIRRLRYTLIPLNIALCMAALVVGGHYLVDIIAGLMIGAAAIFPSDRWLRFCPVTE